MRKRFFLTFVFSLTLALSSLEGMGQSNFAMLTGTVLDPQERAIPGATVQLTSVSTQSKRLVTTNDDGIFKSPASRWANIRC